MTHIIPAEDNGDSALYLEQTKYVCYVQQHNSFARNNSVFNKQ